MFVVRTISQLKEAIRESAREVMVVGMLAPRMQEIATGFTENSSGDVSADFSFTNLFNNFNILEVHDSSQKVIATVFQQRNER